MDKIRLVGVTEKTHTSPYTFVCGSCDFSEGWSAWQPTRTIEYANGQNQILADCPNCKVNNIFTTPNKNAVKQ